MDLARGQVFPGESHLVFQDLGPPALLGTSPLLTFSFVIQRMLSICNLDLQFGSLNEHLHHQPSTSFCSFHDGSLVD